MDELFVILVATVDERLVPFAKGNKPIFVFFKKASGSEEKIVMPFLRDGRKLSFCGHKLDS